MGVSTNRSAVRASNGSGGSVKVFAGQSVSHDDENWFAHMAQTLMAPKAGLALHLLTGFEERTCYRYASGDRRPPAYFLRALLRSDQGWIFLNYIMDGSAASWWSELQRTQRITEIIRQET